MKLYEITELRFISCRYRRLFAAKVISAKAFPVLQLYLNPQDLQQELQYSVSLLLSIRP